MAESFLTKYQFLSSWDPKSTGLRSPSDVSSKSSPVSIVRTKIVDAQISTLRTVVGQLQNAYNGQDVEWNDDRELNLGYEPYDSHI